MENNEENREISVLVVDDSLIMRKAILKYLEDFNIEVVGTANNGEKALELFKKYNPEVVTLDITMPGIDGLYVLKEMVKINNTSKIIVITALADKETGLKSIKMGARSYISKPFSRHTLKQTFERVTKMK